MNTNEIVEEAKKRLAEIETEAARLRAIIVAGDRFWSPATTAPAHPTWIPYPVYIPTQPVWTPRVPRPEDEISPWRLGEVTCAQITSEMPWFVDGAAYRTEYTVTPFSLSAETVRIGGPQTFDPSVRYAVS